MIRRILGLILLVLGLAGLALCGAGIYFTWQAAAGVVVAADESIGLLLDTVDNVQLTLDVASTTLDDAGMAVGALYTTTTGIGDTLGSTRGALGSMAGLAGNTLPQSIETTMTAVDTIEQTAGAIDQVLTSLSMLGLAQYAPEVPLGQAVADVGDSLEGVPEQLRALSAGLEQTEASLGGVQESVDVIAGQLVGIQQNLGGAHVALSGYGAVFRTLHDQLVTLRANVAQPIRTVAWAFTVLLLWIGISQLAILQWGAGLLGSRRTDRPQRKKVTAAGEGPVEGQPPASDESGD